MEKEWLYVIVIALIVLLGIYFLTNDISLAPKNERNAEKEIVSDAKKPAPIPARDVRSSIPLIGTSEVGENEDLNDFARRIK